MQKRVKDLGLTVGLEGGCRVHGADVRHFPIRTRPTETSCRLVVRALDGLQRCRTRARKRTSPTASVTSWCLRADPLAERHSLPSEQVLRWTTRPARLKHVTTTIDHRHFGVLVHLVTLEYVALFIASTHS